MNYRQLFHTDLALSELGLGCASYWGKKIFSERQALAVVHRAIERGVNYFDTGHSYSGGHAEVRLGKALHQSPQRTELIISSKVGTRVGRLGRLYKDFSPQWIRRSCEQSLRHLKTDHLPILFLHGPNTEDFNEDTYRVLEALQQSGQVGLVGVNSFADHILKLTADSGQFQCVMLDYNILTQQRVMDIEKFHRLELNVMAAGAIAGGLYDQRFKQFNGMKSIWYWLRAFKNNRALMQQAQGFAFLNQQANATAIQLALAFVLQQPQLCSALVGTTSVRHLDELLDTDAGMLSAAMAQQIKSLAGH